MICVVGCCGMMILEHVTRLGVEPLNGKRRHGMFLAVKPSVYTETKAGQDYDVFNPDSKAYDASKVTRAGIGLDPSSSDEEFNGCKLKNWNKIL